MLKRTRSRKNALIRKYSAEVAEYTRIRNDKRWSTKYSSPQPDVATQSVKLKRGRPGKSKKPTVVPTAPEVQEKEESIVSATKYEQKRITDLYINTQHIIDHSYTSVDGPQPRVEGEEEETRMLITTPSFYTGHCARSLGLVTVKAGQGTANSASTEHQSDLIAMMSEYEASTLPTVTSQPAVTAASDVSDAQVIVVAPEPDPVKTETRSRRHYPPMPKSELARQGRLEVMEELEGEEADEEGQDEVHGYERPVDPNSFVGRRRRQTNLGPSTDYERKLALKCIRELRLRRKEDTSLACNICDNKMFTATATLLYHYRSHAGIKPFVCLICNTTFTRQHSLNYHMLIHNNQSRFTCKDCGRKFRHPSHFKEHIRRHTGETPFHCTDCPLRFKTRNTYKRHLRTRHYKLLTADGIRRVHQETVTPWRKRGTNEVTAHEEEDEPINSVILPAENTASNKLLQFCSQVVGQGGIPYEAEEAVKEEAH